MNKAAVLYDTVYMHGIVHAKILAGCGKARCRCRCRCMACSLELYCMQKSLRYCTGHTCQKPAVVPLALRAMQSRCRK